VGRKVPQKTRPADGGMKERIGRFVAYGVTNVRLRQGLESLKEQSGGESALMLLRDKKNIPKVQRWVVADVVKEEGDVMRDLGLTEKEVAREVMQRVRDFFDTEVEVEAMAGRIGAKLAL